MTERQRMVAMQLAAALHDALPYGTFDQQRFLDAVLDNAAVPG